MTSFTSKMAICAAVLLSFLGLHATHLRADDPISDIGLTYELVFGEPSVFPETQPVFGSEVLDPNLGARWLFQPSTTIHFKLKDPGHAIPAGLALTIQVRNYRYDSQASQLGSQMYTWSQPLGTFLLGPSSPPYSLQFSTAFPNMPVQSDSVWYLGFSVNLNNLKARLNGEEAGQDFIGLPPQDWPGYALDLSFYYRNQSTLSPATLEDHGLSSSFSNPHAANGHLAPLDGHPLYGGIDNHIYNVRDDSPQQADVFARQWLFYKYNSGTPELISTCRDIAGQTFGDGCHLLTAGAGIVPNSCQVKRPYDPSGREANQYILQCIAFDRYGLPNETVLTEQSPPYGSSAFVLEIGPDPTKNPDNQLLVGLHENGLVIPPSTGRTSFPYGRLYVLPNGPDVASIPGVSPFKLIWHNGDDVQITVPSNNFGNCLDPGDPNVPATWTCYAQLNPGTIQYPIKLSWQMTTLYGETGFSEPKEYHFADNGFIGADMSLHWRDQGVNGQTPGYLVAGSSYEVRLYTENVLGYDTYASLWLVNPASGYAQKLNLPNLGCQVDQSLWDFDVTLPTDLSAFGSGPLTLVAKASWLASATTPSCSQISFLQNFGTTPNGMTQLQDATSAVGIDAPEPLGVSLRKHLAGGGELFTVDVDTGAINFNLSEVHTGTHLPTQLSWRWRLDDGTTTKYWHGGAWQTGDPGLTPLPISTGSNGSDLFTDRWLWDINGVSGTYGISAQSPPFAGLDAAFFGLPGFSESVPVIIEAAMTFANGETVTAAPPLPINLHRYQYVPPPPGLAITDFKIVPDSLNPRTYWQVAEDDLSTTPFALEVLLNQSLGAGDSLRFSLEKDGSLVTGYACEPIANHFAAPTVTVQNDGTLYRYVPMSFTQGFSGPGNYRVRITLSSACGSATYGVTIQIIPSASARYLVRYHYLDGLGSTSFTQAFRMGDSNAQGFQLDGVPFDIQPPETAIFSPYGRLLNAGNAGLTQDVPRFTGHELDTFSGFTYMKGRFHLPDHAAKFNRPDPLRDWDWSNPSSLNLYEYVRNDPINRTDPFGLRTGDQGEEIHISEEFEVAEQSYFLVDAFMLVFQAAFSSEPLAVTFNASGGDLWTIEDLIHPLNKWAFIQQEVNLALQFADPDQLDQALAGSVQYAVTFVAGGKVYKLVLKGGQWFWKTGKAKALEKLLARRAAKSALNAKKAIENLIAGAVEGKTNKSRQFVKSGGVEKAFEDFYELADGREILSHGGDTFSTLLADGSTVSIRNSSRQGLPTVQVNPSSGKKIKVRYE